MIASAALSADGDILDQLMADGVADPGLVFIIYPNYLLVNCVRLARQDPKLSGGAKRVVRYYVGNWDSIIV